jgi:integrase
VAGRVDIHKGKNTVDIHKVGVRAALEPRNEPYWRTLAPNQSIGFRKIDANRGSWIARRKANGRRTYEALGDDCKDPGKEFGYAHAKLAAEKWFASQDQGITEDPTVRKCCEDYVANQRDKRNKPRAAHRAEQLFERQVYEKPLANIRASKLRKHHIQDWIDAQKTSPANLKRRCTPLQAALNLAVKQGKVAADARQAWTGLELPDVPDNRRDLFLDLVQRRALLKAAAGDPGLHDLIEGVMVTGARAGELTGATVSQFDARTGVFKVKDDTKTGTRPVPLGTSGIALFERLSKSKTPLAYLFERKPGLRWTHSSWDHLVRKAAEDAELPEGVCLYTLRHSFITEAISGGLTTLDVCRMVGTSLQMVEKNYGHLVHSVARERLNKVQMV